MTTTRERLAALDAADFDSFGEQDAGPGTQPLATPEEVELIKAEVKDSPWSDPARYPACIVIALETLGLIAVQQEPYAAQVATQALRSMQRRTLHGGPLESMPRGEVV